MKLSKELSDKIKYDLPAEVVEMRFELFDWLKEKGLSVRQAVDLLAMTRGEIIEARRKEMDDMKLYVFKFRIIQLVAERICHSSKAHFN